MRSEALIPKWVEYPEVDLIAPVSAVYHFREKPRWLRSSFTTDGRNQSHRPISSFLSSAENLREPSVSTIKSGPMGSPYRCTDTHRLANNVRPSMHTVQRCAQFRCRSNSSARRTRDAVWERRQSHKRIRRRHTQFPSRCRSRHLATHEWEPRSPAKTAAEFQMFEESKLRLWINYLRVMSADAILTQHSTPELCVCYPLIGGGEASAAAVQVEQGSNRVACLSKTPYVSLTIEGRYRLVWRRPPLPGVKPWAFAFRRFSE